ncbi:MAG: hypothetical protein HY720_28740 [Planctomycetes bacterium]|nr:hypothetical protein [Planctomycetota bacterium]
MTRKSVAVLALCLFALVVPPLPAQDEYRPLDRAERGSEPAVDLYGRVSELLLEAVRPAFSREAKVLVIPVEYPDVRGTTSVEEIRDHFFGEKAESLAGYYREQSSGRCKITGEVHPWVRARLPRRWLEPVPSPLGADLYFPLLLETLLTEEEKERVAEFDVVVFVIAGARVTRWMSLLWPHEGPIPFGGKVLQKIVTDERSAPDQGFSFQTLHHEFGHALGIPDKYCYLAALGIEHDCQIEGVGTHCLMGWGTSPCPWCRIELGWTEPAILRWGLEQRLRLSPSEKGGRVAKIYLGTRARYLLLAYHEGELRVWRIGEPWRRFENHVFWADMECLVAAAPDPAASHALPGGIRIDEVRAGEDGDLRLRLSFE